MPDRNRFVSVRQRDPLTFSGEPSQDVEDWLTGFERVSEHNGWDETLKLANVVFCLAATARTWFDNHEAEMQSWQAFRSAISSTFCAAENPKRLAAEKLATRAQLEGEGFTAYIEDVLWLCRKADPIMSEAEKLSHLMKGVAEDAFQLLVLKSPSTVTDFTEACKKLEEAQRNRLKRLTYTRLPNVAAASFLPPTTADGLDIRAIVREAVREELRAIFPDLSLLTHDQGMCHPTLLATAEAQQAVPHRTQTCSAPCAQHQPREFDTFPTNENLHQTTPKLVASYADVTRRPRGNFSGQGTLRYQSPPRPRQAYPQSFPRSVPMRRTDAWRTEDRRPICFYCGLPGHVYRVCRRRFNDLQDTPYSSSRNEDYAPFDRYRPAQYENRSRADISPRRATSRSPSPSHRRRPSSPYPRTPPAQIADPEN